MAEKMKKGPSEAGRKTLKCPHKQGINLNMREQKGNPRLTLLVGCLAVSLLITILLYFGAAPITRWFINDAETVSHGRTFLQIICLTCPTSTFIFFAITVFQATGKRAQPIFLSLVRKGTTDVLLMPLFYHLIGINGVAWASPAADLVGVLIALAVLLPYLRRLRQMPSPVPKHP